MYVKYQGRYEPNEKGIIDATGGRVKITRGLTNDFWPEGEK